MEQALHTLLSPESSGVWAGGWAVAVQGPVRTGKAAVRWAYEVLRSEVVATGSAASVPFRAAPLLGLRANLPSARDCPACAKAQSSPRSILEACDRSGVSSPGQGQAT